MNLKNLYFQPYKLRFDPEDVFFWSDLHIGHNKDFIWGRRGFSCVEEHDRALIQRWNGKIKDSSIVFHLGDIMFGPGGEKRINLLLNELKFNILYLMGGNHHAGFKQLFAEAEFDDEGVLNTPFDGGKTVIFLPNYFEMILNGQSIVLSHYPICSWNGQGAGSWLLHGHCHGSLSTTDLGKLYYQARAIDLGVETTPNPLNFVELKNILDKKEKVSFDHHDTRTQNPF